MIRLGLLGFYGVTTLASEAVTIELLRLAGTCIGATAAVIAAWLSYKARRELRTRRFRVRDPDHEHAVVVDSPPAVREHHHHHDERKRRA